MNRYPVDSSNVKSVGYDDNNNTLEVEFLNGAIYQYFDVPENIYAGLKSAPSVGSFLASSIKGIYRFSKV